MRIRPRRACLAFVIPWFLSEAVFAQGPGVQAPGVEDLACAAGYGCQGVSSSQCDVLAMLGLMTTGEARDLFAQAYPARFTQVARNADLPPTECLQAAGSGIGTGASPNGSSAQALPDFASLDGFSEAPCPGNVSVDPIFVQGQPDIRVLACFKGADNRYSECGKAPARAYCLKFGQPDVACFGDIKLVGKAATVDAYCETGGCPAFGFIVCK
ncbi:hypothetical protein [Roseibium aggregatum]|uniref:hypothetical protein n=1 Tax=Roseibium aggregatum TaxID=187304 RepID=UPI001A8D436A|nr:hypothetical protein [Roseibium aggregatum]MBN8183181.1 hypothetical protein [Roseibium aggregatum]UES46752.1 hypothetical protein GFK90_24900 [Roseibium aggregatum]